jgi:cytochrome c oxidase cbb3-type subunit 3
MREHEDGEEPIIHEYDGIREADNDLPNWWLGTFFATIVFAGAYWFVYETWHFAPNGRELYAAELAAAAESGGAVSDELLELVAEDPERIEAGRAIFQASCAACHGGRGEGLIGPNLTDGAWIHGGAAISIHATITDGVTSAGMPAWGPVLGPRAVQSVVAYVISIRGTNVPGRAPQGEAWPAMPAPAAEPPGEPAPHASLQ